MRQYFETVLLPQQGLDRWGKGLMSEAVAPATDDAFDRLGFDQIVFSNALGNRRLRRMRE